MVRTLSALLLAYFLVDAAAAADFQLSAAPGPYRVGFHVRQQYDRARIYQPARNPVTAQATGADRSRPLQTLVWYPAIGSGAAMHYRDYVATVATEEEFSRTPDQVRRATELLVEGRAAGPDGARVRRELEQRVRALRDAPERPGKFPVVIYAPSHSAYAMENADLCEYLASQGYIVVASASLGPRSHAMTADLEGAEAQAADIGFLVGYAHTLAQADTGRIGVIGYSWGALANVLAAARDDRIRAVVSLDGSLRAAVEYVNGGPRAARYVTPESLDIPLLYVNRVQGAGQGADDENGIGTDLLARLRYADVYLATMDTASHMDFSSWSLRMAPDAALRGRTRAQAAQAYGATARTVQRFLDARLKDDAAARRQLDADLAPGATPPGLVSFALRRATGAAPTMDTFLDQLGQQGFARIDAIYDGLHAQNPDLSFDPLQLHDWGMKLLREGRAADAVRVLRLGVRLYPERFDFLYDGLGEASEAAGERDAAIASYRHALALEPARAHARLRLEALGAAAQ
ncbi:dienelactone hydrolase family protein [uncultured Massilia sp.]|uniref:dienelactone hydrolase family protein n=1 Tax=uncultured Massilia sp. TaxID=169973 RepID=UPI0025E76255|nr:dienelactone hydrolase family protein [uncultured Massilia sp.]